ncbi:MAG: ATP-binding protein [Actinobacteria bacterium]|nr:ATP-binding protein [Actinomycetota bacterium]
MEILKRYFKSPKNSYFLFGPRGTGKTTWLKLNCENELIIDLLDPGIYRRYKARPERLKELIEGNPDKRNVIIDEVQKVPELLDVVHLIIEEKPELRFILTGSSARKIKQKGVDLLAGRAVVRSLHPFMASELGNRFDLEKALNTGLLPLVFYAQNPIDTLDAYITLYMKEEIQMEGFVRDIGSFARFLEAISFSHGTVLNLNNIARECEVKRETVEGYIEILYDLLMAYSLPVFTKRAKRAVIKHPKFYLFDSGVYRIIRPAGPLDRPGEIDGPNLEGLVAQHIRAWIDYSRSSYKLNYWRTKAGTEVDFIIYGKEGFWAIEVKNTRNISRNELRPLKTFCNDYPECKPVFVYRGNEKLLFDNILCIPCDVFLKSIIPDKPLS